MIIHIIAKMYEGLRRKNVFVICSACYILAGMAVVIFFANAINIPTELCLMMIIVATVFLAAKILPKKAVVSKKNAVAVAMTALYFAFALVGKQLFVLGLGGQEGIDLYISAIAGLLLTFVLCIPVCAIGFYYVRRLILRKDKGTALQIVENSKKHWYIFFMIILGTCVIYNIFYNPAIFSHDSIVQWEQAKTGDYNDNLPVLYAFIIKAVIVIIDSPMALSMLQSIAGASLIASIMQYFCKKGLSLPIAYILTGALAAAPSTPITLITIWKDIPFTLCIVWFLFVSIRLFAENEVYKWKIGIYIEAAICLIGMLLFRHNGIFPAVGSVIVLIAFAGMNKRVAACLLSVLLMYAGFHGWVMRAANVKSVYTTFPQIKYCAMTNDLLGIYYNGGELPNDVVEYLHGIGDLDGKIKETYEVHTANNASWENLQFSPVLSTGEFLSMYLRTFVKSPVRLASAVILRSQLLWCINPDMVNGAHFVGYVSSDVVGYKRSQIPLYNVFNMITTALSAAPLRYITWGVGLWFCILFIIVASMYSICRRRVLLLALPVFVHCIGLLIASGWPDFRYVWCVGFCCYFIGITMLCIEPGKE